MQRLFLSSKRLVCVAERARRRKVVRMGAPSRSTMAMASFLEIFQRDPPLAGSVCVLVALYLRHAQLSSRRIVVICDLCSEPGEKKASGFKCLAHCQVCRATPPPPPIFFHIYFGGINGTLQGRYRLQVVKGR